ncbi:MAG: pur operon repressor [Clostridia bacterium]|nr:pur operon repressor [Clostridia bacterium]
MDKLQKNERFSVMTKMLSDSPGKIFTLGGFAEMFGSAKSTVSEDIDIIQNLFSKFGMGVIETIAGASGGVRFVPTLSISQINNSIDKMCDELKKRERILPGGYLYMLDIIYNPDKVSNIGKIFVGQFYKREIDYVVTVETKGIPLAFMTAKYLNVPLVIVRHTSEATDGASVNINYVSGSSRKIQNMVLSLKALKRHSKILFIDDFMKGGGTAKGIIELSKEFECEVVGIGVLVETAEPKKKLVDNYFSIMTLHNFNEENDNIDIKPSMNWA